MAKSEIEFYWPEIEPLLQRAEADSMHECTADDILRLLFQGGMHAFVILRDDHVQLVYITELLNYPQYAVVNIVAIGGKNLKKALRYLPALETWALTLGAVAIRGFCKNPAIVRLYRMLKLPFRPIGTVVEHDLRGKLQ